MFKLATLVYRSPTGTAPAYLSDECHLTSSVGVRPLRSADSRTCVPRRAHNGYYYMDVIYTEPKYIENYGFHVKPRKRIDAPI